MEWIENRSTMTRWILVPILFISSASLIKGSVIIVSWFLSIFWGEDAEFNLWFYEIFIANSLSAYCAAYFSGWTAPKFQVATTCVAAAIFLLANSFIVYKMFTLDGWWGSDTIFSTLSTTGGVIVAILVAKNNLAK